MLMLNRTCRLFPRSRSFPSSRTESQRSKDWRNYIISRNCTYRTMALGRLRDSRTMSVASQGQSAVLTP